MLRPIPLHQYQRPKKYHTERDRAVLNAWIGWKSTLRESGEKKRMRLNVILFFSGESSDLSTTREKRCTVAIQAPDITGNQTSSQHATLIGIDIGNHKRHTTMCKQGKSCGVVWDCLSEEHARTLRRTKTMTPTFTELSPIFSIP